MISNIFKTVLNTDLGEFPVMAYADAMHRFGSDKPDLRVNLEFTELTDVMADVDFKVFSAPATTAGGRVVALRVPGGASTSTRVTGAPSNVRSSEGSSRAAPSERARSASAARI